MMSGNWLTIIGGGIAGLSLCDELIALYSAAGKPVPGKIVLLERRTAYTNDRTFSFFSKHAPAGIPYRKYMHWRFSKAPNGDEEQPSVKQQSGSHFAYYSITASDVCTDLLSRVTKHPQVELMLGVNVNDCEINSRIVIDTRPCKVADMRIKQSFIGVEVALPQKMAINTADLMCNMRMVEGCFTFDYILPISAHKALVEVTQFATEPASQTELSACLHDTLQKLGVTGSAEREEAAILPMGLQRSFHNQLGSQQIRTATGYGYLETKRWARQAAMAILRGRTPSYTLHSALLRWFDARMLRVIESEPEQLAKVFMRMAENTSGDTFAQFMSAPSAVSLLKIMAAVPKSTFLRTLYA